MTTPDPPTHGVFAELLAREDLSPEVRQKLQELAEDIEAQYQRMQGPEAVAAGERAFARRPRIRLSAGNEPGSLLDADEVGSG